MTEIFLHFLIYADIEKSEIINSLPLEFGDAEMLVV